ncbi:MAG: NAD(P)-dependent oxidoreductase [Bacteroidetes bacterium]|nr:MAG: NAD(P)-dependent oxidoreductase [Bacteroidota bacterium]TAG92559.1 MAG: NAD(P)-dependent oxidoreductase [Bacteroidota bacterium]
MNFKGKTVFITGASRGIGKSIALRLAAEGANIVVAAKTAEPHPKLEGTIYQTAEEVEKAGGKALPLVVDVREETQVYDAVKQAVEKFGGIDILVNNASAIQLTDTLSTDMKRYDLMHHINTRGTFLCSKACIPHLLKAENPHVLNLSPPLSMETKWFAPHVAYTMAKFGMSMCVLGMSGEFKNKIAFNALWPRTTIATAAVNMLGGDAMMNQSRKPEIMSDAAFAIFSKPVSFSGNFLVDEDFLRSEGVTDFEHYSNVAGSKLLPDFFV